jgi:hypothetical protein
VYGRQQSAELRQVSEVEGKRNPLSTVQPSSWKKAGPVEGLDTQASLAAGLIFGSPEFQRR